MHVNITRASVRMLPCHMLMQAILIPCIVLCETEDGHMRHVTWHFVLSISNRFSHNKALNIEYCTRLECSQYSHRRVHHSEWHLKWHIDDDWWCSHSDHCTYTYGGHNNEIHFKWQMSILTWTIFLFALYVSTNTKDLVWIRLFQPWYQPTVGRRMSIVCHMYFILTKNDFRSWHPIHIVNQLELNIPHVIDIELWLQAFT